MEWQGINLNGYNQHQWVKMSIRNLIIIIAIFIALSIITIFIILQHQDIQYKNRLLNNEITEIENKITQTQNNIEKLKQNAITNNQSIKKEHIYFLNQYLNNFKEKGTLEIIQIYIDNHTKIKIIGKVKNQEQFMLIEQQLKQENTNYQITHLYTREDNLLSFQIIIDLQG
ncbi:hypothetical protein A1D25_01440 [Ursidibacter arcticus]|uniref:hypothetical protein n=1 Tax=Ursidibacter arcticus TaxID=1524965 RepID=UPI0012FAC4BA|nr:hypothetical protein [Ursidibacter arcticus]KAE9531780.1 hypothetical protein A1D25_01440 [Ursidibacter arcticus]